MLPELQIIQTVKNIYGREALKVVRKYEEFAVKESLVNEQLFYLHNCQRHDVMPKSIAVSPPVNSDNSRRIASRYKKEMLKELINDAHRRKDAYCSKIRHFREACSAVLPTEVMTEVDQCIENIKNHKRNKKRQALDEKFSRLKRSNTTTPAQPVHNVSDYSLTETETAVLSKGLKFNHGDANPLQFIAAFEAGLRHNRDESQNVAARATITRLLSDKTPNRVLNHEESQALKRLRNNEELTIAPADKGNAVVVMNTNDYKSKALNLLGDTNVYSEIDGTVDPMKRLRNKLNTKLSNLRKQKRLSDEDYKFLTPTEGPVPRFYGLPKVHKEGVPLRPIVSNCNAPSRPVAKYLARLLQPVVQNHPNYISNVTDFITIIKNIRLEADESMLSFDVCSLFTSIPSTLAIRLLGDLLKKDTQWRSSTKLTVDDIIELATLCTETYLQFDGKIYQQLQGTPMGSPLSGILAEVTMQHFEHTALPSFQPKLWLRYVDDTFVVIKRSNVQAFHEHINKVMPEIKFTKEESTDNKLPFLDVLLIREADGALNTTVYRKPTTTDVLLSFESNHPIAHKKGCVRTAFERAKTHCSTHELYKTEVNYLRNLFVKNGYPTSFVNAARRNKQPAQRQEEEQQSGPRTVVLPYIRGVSEASERLLRPLNIRVAHRPVAKLRNTCCKLKDPVPQMEQAGVVYNIPCGQCSQNYVGETGKMLKSRVHEHELALRRADLNSHIWQHCSQTGHDVDFNNTTILARNEKRSERQVLESLHSAMGNTYNRCVQIDPHYATVATKLLPLRESQPTNRVTNMRTNGNVSTAPLEGTPTTHMTHTRSTNNAITGQVGSPVESQVEVTHTATHTATNIATAPSQTNHTYRLRPRVRNSQLDSQAEGQVVVTHTATAPSQTNSTYRLRPRVRNSQSEATDSQRRL